MMAVLARLRRRRVPPPVDSDEFKLWFSNATEAAFRRSFSAIPDSDLIPALYALLLRAGSASVEATVADAEDAAAVRAYVEIAKRHGTLTMAIAYRVAVCAAIDDMRVRHARDAALAKAETGTSR